MDKQQLREMARHLPPGNAGLKVIDMSAEPVIRALMALRPDVEPVYGALDSFEDDTIDAITAYDASYQIANWAAFLKQVLRVLRPGGRLILFTPDGLIDRRKYTLEEEAIMLHQAGFVRMLSERIFGGVLTRGEKPYQEDLSTTERIESTVQEITDTTGVLIGSELLEMKARFVYLLIKSTPNKPVWSLKPDETIHWTAVAVGDPDRESDTVLAFTSLPRAVHFMQNAVLVDAIQDVNKIAKFGKGTASTWPFHVWLNPQLHEVKRFLPGIWMSVDPTTAEAPDE